MKFSITIPAYKQRYLSEAIESCLAQTYKDFEVIIVDDASPEDLKSVVDKFDDARIRYYRNEKNCGALNVVDNWNICLGYVQGDYVICMGDDDRLLPNCLEEYVNLIKAYPEVDVFHGWTEIIDEESNVVDINEPRPLKESVYSLIYYRLKGRQQYIGDFLYKTETLRKNGGYYYLPLAWGSDDITAFIAAESHGIVNSQKVLFQYRKNRYTISKSSNCKIQIQSFLEFKQWVIAFLDKRQKGASDIYYVKIKGELKHLFKKKMLGTIGKDLSSNGLKNILFWHANAKKYNLSSIDVVSVILKYLNSRR